MSEQPYVVNPDAVGDPEQTPIVHVSPGLAALLRQTQCPLCGHINQFHADDCVEAKA